MAKRWVVQLKRCVVLMVRWGGGGGGDKGKNKPEMNGFILSSFFAFYRRGEKEIPKAII